MENPSVQATDKRPRDLRDRTLLFSRTVIRFIRPFQSKMATRSMADQLLRSATSIGANFVEAKNSGTRKDFRHKCQISKKEAAETLYWLKLFEEFTSDKLLFELEIECQELILILQKIIDIAKNTADPHP